MSEPIQRISAEPDSLKDYIQKVKQYKSLIWVFAKRDLKVKYAQTSLGIAWTIIQPLTGLIIFTFFFSYILKWEAEFLPYSVHILTGLLGWNFFSYIVSNGSMSINESSSIIKKIYFPKSILPFSKVLVALVELGISFLLLVPLLIYFKLWLSWKIIFIPLVLLFNVFCALAIVFWLSSFAYKNRDLLHLLPYILNFGIWLTPVFFTNDILPENLQFLMEYNPMANVVNMWRWALFDQVVFQPIWIVNFIIISIIMVIGIIFYNKRENEFSDFV